MVDRPSFSLDRREAPCPTCGEPSVEVQIGATLIPVLCEECQDRVENEERRAERAHRVDAALARAGGARMREWSLASYPRDETAIKALHAASAWIEGWKVGQRRNLILFGKVGSGKTGLAWSVLRHLIEEYDADGLVVNFRDLLVELKQSFDDRQMGLPTEYVRAPKVQVLVLDDLGCERPTDFAREELASLVERRYNARLVTIVTSNYEPGKLAERLGHDELVVGSRIVSRLQEDSIQHRIDGRDRRIP